LKKLSHCWAKYLLPSTNHYGIWYLYEVSELAIGGHCGCCGKWVDKAIVEKGWEWTLCDECAKGWYEKGPAEED